MTLDRSDRDILRVLQEDGRISNQALAAQVGLSPAPCWRRVKQLREAGLIRGYVALLNAEAIGLGLTGFVQVSLNDHHPDTVAAFDALVADLPEVMECCALSGQYDYMLRVVAADMAAFEALINGKLLRLLGVQSCNTSFVLKQKKWSTALPLDALSAAEGRRSRR